MTVTDEGRCTECGDWVRDCLCEVCSVCGALVRESRALHDADGATLCEDCYG
jgi:hypothetical protein